MTISENGSATNGVHESSHGYDIWEFGKYDRDNNLEGEVKAYNRQYSYDKSSMPSSYWSNVKNSCDITKNWVLGVYTQKVGEPRDYLYARYMLQGTQLYSPSYVEKLLNSKRKP